MHKYQSVFVESRNLRLQAELALSRARLAQVALAEALAQSAKNRGVAPTQPFTGCQGANSDLIDAFRQRGRRVDDGRVRAYPAFMSAEATTINLPEGWTCSLELKRGLEGTFGGRAELLQGHSVRCVLMLTQCPTRDAAIEQFQRRMESFIADQTVRRGVHIGRP